MNEILERDGYLPGIPCWVDTGQPDPEAAGAFYGGLFGWDVEETTPPGASERYFLCRLRGRDVAGIASQPEGGGSGASWNQYVWVESADDAAAAAEAAGGTVLLPPMDVGDLGRTSVVADPAGATFSLWEAREHRGAQAVNEPGSWNFSALNTGDPEGAKAFYGDLFGWRTAASAGDGSAMFMRPGYLDFLAERDPGIRERHDAVGAPEGFGDVVAWMMELEVEDGVPSGADPHWSMTFSVSDADKTAELAQKLGGEVLVPPADAEWVRMTVIRDPQGAVFTASKFTPPQ